MAREQKVQFLVLLLAASQARLLPVVETITIIETLTIKAIMAAGRIIPIQVIIAEILATVIAVTLTAIRAHIRQRAIVSHIIAVVVIRPHITGMAAITRSHVRV